MKNRQLLLAIQSIQSHPIGDSRCSLGLHDIIEGSDNSEAIEMLARFVSKEELQRMKDNPDKDITDWRRPKGKWDD